MSYYPRYPVRYGRYSTNLYSRRNPRSFTNKRRKKYQKPMRYKVADYGYSAYKMALQLKKTLNVEYKHNDKINTISPSWLGDVTDVLNQISQGDTSQTRDGNSIKMVKLTFRYTIIGTVNSVLRFIILNDKNDKVTQVSDVISATGSVNSPNSFKDYDNRFQTSFICDEKVALDTAGNLMSTGTIVKDLNLHSNFDGATTTPIGNVIRLLVISDRETTDYPTIRYVSRISFVDN